MSVKSSEIVGVQVTWKEHMKSWEGAGLNNEIQNAKKNKKTKLPLKKKSLLEALEDGSIRGGVGSVIPDPPVEEVGVGFHRVSDLKRVPTLDLKGWALNPLHREAWNTNKEKEIMYILSYY